MPQFKFNYHNRDGVIRNMIADRDTPDDFVVETKMDLEPIIDGVARDRDLIDPKSNNKLLARVPMTIYEKSMREQWGDADWRKWLNDPQNDPFRVWRGRV